MIARNKMLSATLYLQATHNSSLFNLFTAASDVSTPFGYHLDLMVWCLAAAFMLAKIAGLPVLPNFGREGVDVEIVTDLDSSCAVLEVLMLLRVDETAIQDHIRCPTARLALLL